VRDTSTKWCCDQDWDEERWGFTREKKRPPAQASTAPHACILFVFWRAADLLIVRSARLLLDSRWWSTDIALLC